MTNHTKKSFSPIASSDIEILILGSVPSDTSLSKGEYYAHPRNRFWKIIAEITNEQLPTYYEDKKALLKRHKIGLWDVAEAVNRKGSMDADILDATPNDIDGFVREHKKIKVIGFNGTKAMNLFANFFTFNSDILYLKLPSTSPANAGVTFDGVCKEWEKILAQRH
jgi:hypoxanthine-DNA glycosylase